MKLNLENLEKNGSGSILVFLFFLALKLTGSINWSWWWVTSPLWIPPVAIILILTGFFVTLGVLSLLGRKVDWNVIKKKTKN
jgi:membrane protein YdbS with pleckstrin-like domain